jgi:type IV pilus assembly protein PilC
LNRKRCGFKGKSVPSERRKMGEFTYTAKGSGGQTVKGSVEATDKKQALERLREKGLLVLKLEETAKHLRFLSLKGKKRASSEEMVIIFRQLATMIEAGIPVVASLDILTEQAESQALKKVLSNIRDSVNTGASLSDAMMKHPKMFTPFFVYMIRAGESSGTLDLILDRIATYIEKTVALQRKIQAALIYPAVVSSMAIIITVVLLIKVVPVFKDIFSAFDAALPGPTQFLINVSDFMRKYFLIVILIMFGIVILIRAYSRTPRGRFVFDNLKLRMPIYGTLLRKVSVSRFTRTLSTLVKSGVPILSALEIVAKTSGNVAIEKSVNEVRESVRNGESIAAPLERSYVFPPMVTRMVAVGEKSGQLEKMLSKISDFYDSQVDTAVSGLTSMIEPLIIAFLGVVIGSIVLCMFMPIFKLSTIISF